MPRILLVVDEFQEFFTEDDRFSQTASLLLDRLVRQGRAFGIHVLLGSQTLGGAYSLARTTIGQMAVRIALQCSETDASLILSEDNTAARLLTRPGEAIYNDANGMIEGNSPFQVAWLGDEERDAHLERIREFAARKNRPPVSPIVFEGNLPADPAQNAALVERIETALNQTTTAATRTPPSAWIGEAVAITGPTVASFPAQSGTNLLLVGSDAAAAQGILATCLISLATETISAGDVVARRPTIHLLSSAGASGQAGRWNTVLEVIPDAPAVTPPGQAEAIITELATELARRKENAETYLPPMFLLVEDLSRFRELRRSEDDFGFGGFDRERTPTAAQRFAELLKDGPSLGIHTIIWCDSYGNADRWLGRALLREFDIRIVFQMNATDSSHLIDSPAANRLGTNRALLYRDERGTVEKFRPYGPPSEDWLAWVRTRLRPDSPGEPDRPEDLDIDEWIIV